MSQTTVVREKRLILDAVPCDTNFYADGPRTVDEAKRAGRSMCPHFDTCNNGELDANTGHQCVMLFAVQVAGYAIKQCNSVSSEVRGDFGEFIRTSCNPPKGFIWSSDRKEFVFITDKDEVLKKVEEFASSVLGTSSTSRPTQAVGDSYAAVVAHAMTKNGAIDLSRVQELEGRFGYNGGRGCDTRRGPCSCGAWH